MRIEELICTRISFIMFRFRVKIICIDYIITCLKNKWMSGNKLSSTNEEIMEGEFNQMIEHKTVIMMNLNCENFIFIEKMKLFYN